MKKHWLNIGRKLWVGNDSQIVRGSVKQPKINGARMGFSANEAQRAFETSTIDVNEMTSQADCSNKRSHKRKGSSLGEKKTDSIRLKSRQNNGVDSLTILN